MIGNFKIDSAAVSAVCGAGSGRGDSDDRTSQRSRSSDEWRCLKYMKSDKFLYIASGCRGEARAQRGVADRRTLAPRGSPLSALRPPRHSLSIHCMRCFSNHIDNY